MGGGVFRSDGDKLETVGLIFEAGFADPIFFGGKLASFGHDSVASETGAAFTRALRNWRRCVDGAEAVRPDPGVLAALLSLTDAVEAERFEVTGVSHV